MYIEREITPYIRKLATMFPVVMVTGPRQSGKSTLVKEIFPEHEYVTMDDYSELAKARNAPDEFLASKSELVIVDEAQKAPMLFDAIKLEVDKRKTMGRFILTGSNQPELFEKVSESLAGRVAIAELMPFSFSELNNAGIDISQRDTMLYKGFMPGIHADGIDPEIFYSGYLRTYVERDVRKLVNVGDLGLFETFIQLLAGRVGQLVNRDSLANDVGVGKTTIARWITLLRTSYIVFTLRPYYNNFGKRITKAPKIYFTDTGLVSYLLGINSPKEMATHPLMGNIFENMVMAEAFKARFNAGKRPKLYFYRNSSGTVEIDLLREDGLNLYAHEIKASATFNEKMTRGLKTFATLAPNLRRSTVIYSGATCMPIAANFADTSALMSDN